MKTTEPIGQGHGKKGRYAGLPDPYGSESFAKIIVLPVPFDKTSTYQRGSNRGPAALIEASRNLELYDIETGSEVYLNGIFTAPSIRAKTSAKMLEETYQRTKRFLQQGKFSVLIGGEHTVSYGAIRAHAEYYGELTVLQLDAHADLQMTYENNPWSHACIMARVKELPNVKVVSVGIRSMSREELPYLDRPRTFFAAAVHENSHWVSQVLDLLSGLVYITIDLDVFDSSSMPSTGTPEPGGLDWMQVVKLLKQVAAEKTLVGFDIVELCPKVGFPAPDYLAAKLLYKLLSYRFLSK
jgi:agmatinase